MGQAAGEACRITPPGSPRALSARPAAALRTRICALGHLRMSHVTHYNGQLEMGATCCPAAGTVTSAGQQRRQTPAWVSVGSRVASDMPEPARPCVPCVSEDGGHQLPPGDQATSRLHHKAPAPALAELGELSLSMGVERAGQPPGHVVATASLYAPVPWALGALRGDPPRPSRPLPARCLLTYLSASRHRSETQQVSFRKEAGLTCSLCPRT